MYNILEGIKPYVLAVIACLVVSLLWTFYVNRGRYKLLLSRTKTVRNLKRRGTEVILVTGYIGLKEVDGYAQVVLNFGNYYVRLDDIDIYGNWNSSSPNTVKLLFKDGKVLAACFSQGELNDKIHASFMEQARHVFITVLGVYAIWYIMSKM